MFRFHLMTCHPELIRKPAKCFNPLRLDLHKSIGDPKKKEKVFPVFCAI